MCDPAQRFGGAESAAGGDHVEGVVGRLELAARASRRTRSTNLPGVSPTSVLNTRVKWRRLMAAAAARTGTRWSPPGAASTNACTARTVERSAVPHPHGGGELRLAARPMEEHHQPAGHRLGHVDAEVLLDQGERQIYALAVTPALVQYLPSLM